ncbi:NRX2A protein, partial [Hirundo rustica]|nr:NRX2A protein [Hirundo rustica]
MTRPVAEGPPAPGGRPETQAHLGPVTHPGPVTHHGAMAPQGSEGHQETRAHLGSVATRGSAAGWTSTVGRETEAHPGSVTHPGDQDRVEAEARPGSAANPNLVGDQDRPQPGAGGGPAALLDSKISRSSEEHPGTRAGRVPVSGREHPRVKAQQESAARRRSAGDRDGPEPTANAPSDCKVTRGPAPTQRAEVNQSPAAAREAEVSEEPVLCLDLRAHPTPEDPRDPVAHPDPQADRAPVALADRKFLGDPREAEARRGPPEPRVPREAAAPRCRAPSGARLGLALLTLGSLLLPCARGSALEFGGAPGQWARYGRWAPGAGGQLSFRLKTNVTRALLLYLDDGGNCDFLELLVAEGRLRLRFAIACAEPATLEPPAPVSDGRWHAVLLTRQARHAALAVDGE